MKKKLILLCISASVSLLTGQTGSWGYGSNVIYSNPVNAKIGLGNYYPSEKLEIINGNVFVNSENSGLVVDAAGNKRIGLIKYSGHETVLSRVLGQDFGIAHTSDGNLFNSNITYDFYIAGNNNIGIGSTSPDAKLFINNTGNTQPALKVKTNDMSATAIQVVRDNFHGFSVLATGKTLIGLNATTIAEPNSSLCINGKAQIGNALTTSSTHYNDYLLSVNGKGVFKEIIVTNLNWADFVFEKDYKLATLKEIEEYYTKYKHLPEIPTAKEVEENGISVGEMNKLLLQKIEELTIYLVQQQKEIDALKAK